MQTLINIGFLFIHSIIVLIITIIYFGKDFSFSSLTKKQRKKRTRKIKNVKKEDNTVNF